MAKITYIDPRGVAHTVDLNAGMSLMEGAVQNNIPGIDAECGGACSCATCHVYIDQAWREKVGPPSPNEAAMLDCVDHTQENSRLSCQVPINEELDGLVVQIPKSQG